MWYRSWWGGGGGYEIRNNLARIPLRWMVHQCFLLNTGIIFHRPAFNATGMDVSTLWPIVKPRPPPKRFPSSPNSTYKPFPSGKESDGETQGTGNAVAKTKRSGRPFTSKEEEDLQDALSPINDTPKPAKSWWISELLPQGFKFQKDDNYWVRVLSWVIYIHKTGATPISY